MELKDFQKLIEDIYFERDSARDLSANLAWLVEEVGELCKAVRIGNPEQVANEFADVMAWVSTLASIYGISLEEAVKKYARGCPKCGQIPCGCPPFEQEYILPKNKRL